MTDAEVTSGAPPRKSAGFGGAELPLGRAAGLGWGISLPGPALLAPPAGSHQGQALLGRVRLGGHLGGGSHSVPGLAGSPATVGSGLRGCPAQRLELTSRLDLFIFRSNDSLALWGPDVISGLKSNTVFLRKRILNGFLVKIFAAFPVNGTPGRRGWAGFSCSESRWLQGREGAPPRPMCCRVPDTDENTIRVSGCFPSSRPSHAHPCSAPGCL